LEKTPEKNSRNLMKFFSRPEISTSIKNYSFFYFGMNFFFELDEGP